MSAFSNIPAQAVLPLGAYSLDDLTRCAQRADQRLLQADLAESRSRSDVMSKLASSFSLPKHFGHNLDALYDCVTDLKPIADASHPGFVVILKNIPETSAFDAKARDALLDVFREAADYFFDHETAFRVFYSIARDADRSRKHDN